MTEDHWHPWRALRHRADIDITFDRGVRSRTRWTATGIDMLIDVDRTQATRRSVAAHELIHAERGPAPDNPAMKAREEAAVDREAARRLIPLDRLAAALRWTRCIHEAADELWVHPHVLSVRLASLTPHERRTLEGTSE